MERGYVAFIGRMVRHSGLMVILALCLSGVGFYGLARLPDRVHPDRRPGLPDVAVQLPEGAALGRTAATLQKVAEGRRNPGRRAT